MHELLANLFFSKTSMKDIKNWREFWIAWNIFYVANQKVRFLRIIYLYRVLSGNKDRPLTRLHLHTLAYQAILVTENSPWKNTRFAAAKASLTANRHVCASQKVWNLFKPIFLFNSLNVLMANQISKLLQPCFQRVNRTIH